MNLSASDADPRSGITICRDAGTARLMGATVTSKTLRTLIPARERECRGIEGWSLLKNWRRAQSDR